MTKLIHLDIAALLILVIILISQFTRRMSKGTTNHFFIALVIMTILSGAADIWAVVLANAESLNLGLRTAAHTLYLLAYNTISPLFLMYVISLTSTWEKITLNKVAACALTLPYLGVIGLLVSNLFTHSIFTFVDGVYTTMPLSFLPYTMARINILISIAYIIIYRRLFTVRKLIALIMMLPVTVCIIISKIIFTDTMVMVFGNTVGVVIIAVMIQRPDNLIDSFTGLCKHSAYAADNAVHNQAGQQPYQRRAPPDGENRQVRPEPYPVRLPCQMSRGHRQLPVADIIRHGFPREAPLQRRSYPCRRKHRQAHGITPHRNGQHYRTRPCKSRVPCLLPADILNRKETLCICGSSAETNRRKRGLHFP